MLEKMREFSHRIIYFLRVILGWFITGWSKLSLVICALAVVIFLYSAWRTQASAPLSCRVAFGQLAEHNGYMQVNVLHPHANEEYFNSKLYLYYPSAQSPPTTMRLTLHARGKYAPSITRTVLEPWSKGRATPRLISMILPTPGVSQKLFPFDSPEFDLVWNFDPPLQPKVVIIRNLSPDFIPNCSTLFSKWTETGELQVKIDFHRNPFVQTATIIIGLIALAFGVLLSRIHETNNLTVATASYFFSVWSVRGIVAPPGLPHPTGLDLWFMGITILVLFLVAWRLLDSKPSCQRRPETNI